MSQYFDPEPLELFDGEIARAEDVNSLTNAADAAFTVLEEDYADAVTTSTENAALTAEDAAATAADRVQTGLDRVATAADRVQTGLDAAATAADRVQTGLDRVATGEDAVAAAASADAAAISAAESDVPTHNSDAAAHSAAIGAHDSVTNPHSATSAASASRLILRDSAGRAQVAAPSAAADIATKGVVDTVQTNLNSHTGSANPHSGHALTSTSITAGNGLSGGGTLAATRTITMGTPTTLSLSTSNTVGTSTHAHALSGVASNAISITAGDGLSGGGTLAATRTITMGTPSSLSYTSSNWVGTTTHTHALTISSNFHNVGSYCFVAGDVNSLLVGNSDYAGSTLRPAGIQPDVTADFGVASAGFTGVTLSGTWRIMGHVGGGSGIARRPVTLAVRIA
jgi:hypothetical protein